MNALNSLDRYLSRPRTTSPSSSSSPSTSKSSTPTSSSASSSAAGTSVRRSSLKVSSSSSSSGSSSRVEAIYPALSSESDSPGSSLSGGLLEDDGAGVEEGPSPPMTRGRLKLKRKITPSPVILNNARNGSTSTSPASISMLSSSKRRRRGEEPETDDILLNPNDDINIEASPSKPKRKPSKRKRRTPTSKSKHSTKPSLYGNRIASDYDGLEGTAGWLGGAYIAVLALWSGLWGTVFGDTEGEGEARGQGVEGKGRRKGREVLQEKGEVMSEKVKGGGEGEGDVTMDTETDGTAAEDTDAGKDTPLGELPSPRAKSHFAPSSSTRPDLSPSLTLNSPITSASTLTPLELEKQAQEVSDVPPPAARARAEAKERLREVEERLAGRREVPSGISFRLRSRSGTTGSGNSISMSASGSEAGSEDEAGLGGRGGGGEGRNGGILTNPGTDLPSASRGSPSGSTNSTPTSSKRERAKLLPNPLSPALMTRTPSSSNTPTLDSLSQLPAGSGAMVHQPTPSRGAPPSYSTSTSSLLTPPLPLTRLPPTLTPFHSRKTLILDLDETLIHSTSRPMNVQSSGMGGGSGLVGISLSGLLPGSQRRGGGGGRGEGHTVEVVLGGRSTLYHVYKRPFVDHFLKKVSSWYTLVIFTASMQEYADPVIDWLDGGRNLFGRKLYRESCSLQPNGSYIKDLTLVDDDLSRVCFMDNSPVSYNWNKANALPIEGWTSDPNDKALLDALPVLDSLRFTSDVRRVLGIRGF